MSVVVLFGPRMHDLLARLVSKRVLQRRMFFLHKAKEMMDRRRATGVGGGGRCAFSAPLAPSS